MRRRSLIALLLLVLPAAGCEESLGNLADDPAPRKVVEMSTFLVTLDSDQGLGSESARLPAGAATIRLYVTAQALFSDGRPFPGFGREVQVLIQPGEIVPGITARGTFTDGRIERMPIDVNFAFGSTKVWVEDILGAGASYVTGVSQDPVWFESARIRSVQECDREAGGTCRGNSPDFFRSPLEGRFVRMFRHHEGQGDLVITGVTTEGFFVTDTSEPNDYEFGSLYVYNHNRPEGLHRGQRLHSLAGNVTEFFGLTELGFPSWERLPCDEGEIEGVGYNLCRGTVDESSPDDPEEYAEGGSASVCPVGKKCCAHDHVLVDLDPPECTGTAPDRICTVGECLPHDCPTQRCDPNQVCRDGRCIDNPNLFDPVLLEEGRVKEHWDMEKLEGGLVRAERVKVLKIDRSDFEDYGQWQVQFPDGSTKLTVVSLGAVPDFHPDQEEGACINIQGSLRFHSVPRWTIYPRDPDDLERTTGCQ